MLRSIFVAALILFGIVISFHGSFYALLFYLWMAYFRPTSWMWDSSFLRSLKLSYYTGLFLVVSTLFSRVKLRFTVFAGLLLLVLVHSLISSLRSNYSITAFSSWRDFLPIIIITYLITMLIRSEKELKITLIVMSLSLGLEGARQGWYHLIFRPGAANHNKHALLGDNNGVAVGMLMLAPIFFALYQTTERKIIKYGFLFLAIGVMYRALSTYSRGGFLTFFAMCIIFWLRSKHKARLTLAAVLFFALILPTLPQEFWDRMDTITVNEDGERESSSARRIYFWELAWRMAKSNPLHGVGHDSYRDAYSAFDYTGDRINRATHSAWFGVLAEWGFPGLFLFLSIYGYSLFSCARVRRRCKNSHELRFLRIYVNGIETSLITASVGITFLSLQYLEMLWHLFALAVACNHMHRLQEATEDTRLNNIVENTDLLERETT